MNDFKDLGLDESNFGDSGPLDAVKAFDAFPKTKPSYQQRTATGGIWTTALIVASLWLTWSEVSRWWVGETTHTFAVEQGVGHDLQINVDLVVAMHCEDLHINVQDASGDRIMAGTIFHKDNTMWRQWTRDHHTLGSTKAERLDLKGYPGFGEYQEEDVHNYVGSSHTGKKFPKTPKIPRGLTGDSCRIYGNIHGNKVKGDFHITARGHGYMEFGQHLDHTAFNFSHLVSELSFGPYYPSLVNPLDSTVATTNEHFYKYQYYLSLVPTIYTTNPRSLGRVDKYHESPTSGEDGLSQQPPWIGKNTVFTNQYAVTEQSRSVSEINTPGIFLKFEIEPIQLTIAETWKSLPALFIRIVNVVSGLLVAGGWCYQLTEWGKEIYGRKKKGGDSFGMLDGHAYDAKHAV